MLQTLLENEVRFLVVGAYALAVYGYPRATGDFDLWVEATQENSKKILSSLMQFGAPIGQVSEETFAEQGVVFQIGVAPRRIDILTHIDGVDFQEAYQAKEEITLEGMAIPFLSKENLIKNKKSTGREKDILDAKTLEKGK
jgi:hypothetical protein